MNRHDILSGGQLALRAAVAGSFAVAIAKMLSFDYPIFAFISAVLVTDLSPAVSRKLGFNRLIATVIGALWGALLTPLIPSGPVAIGFGVFVAMATCHVLIGVARGLQPSYAGLLCWIIIPSRGHTPSIVLWKQSLEWRWPGQSVLCRSCFVLKKERTMQLRRNDCDRDSALC